MSSRKYDTFKDLRKNKYDWKVQARVMNMWRGYTKTKEPFKSFNLLLVDHKRARIHAFVPGNIADQLESSFEVGNIYLIENFTVKDYTPKDNFRCLRKDIQIVFSDQTNVTPLEDNVLNIEKYVFDLFDLEELKPLSMQNKYLTDVIGFMESPQPLAKFKNKHGQVQSQIRFKITDGSSSVKVSFWDEFAELFAETLKRDFEYPIIIIIGSGRVTQWSDEVDISNVAATTFYLNINHHSVNEMRKMLLDPTFSRTKLSTAMNRAPKLYSTEFIKNLGEENIETEVLCQVKIVKVEQTKKWFIEVCTSCYQEAEIIGSVYRCNHCKRKGSYPDKKFQLLLTAMDASGSIEIMLEDREVRTLSCTTVFNLIDEGCVPDKLPPVLKTLEEKNYTIRVFISKENIRKESAIYIARDILEGFDYEAVNVSQQQSHPHPIENMEPQASGSSYHLDNLSGKTNELSGY